MLTGSETVVPASSLDNGRWLSYVPTAIDRFLNLPAPDYDADDVLVVAETEQLRALADDARHRIITLLRERAATTTELAEAVGLAKGTVAHHLKVLEAAGLVKVVRTRRVRAVTESFYGRVARLFVLKVAEEGDHLRVRLSPADAAAFHARLVQFRLDLQAADAPAGEEFELIASLYPVGGYS
jgi:DNA-binding transcriptional ArsR family regulator